MLVSGKGEVKKKYMGNYLKINYMEEPERKKQEIWWSVQGEVFERNMQKEIGDKVTLHFTCVMLNLNGCTMIWNLVF